MVDGPLRDLGAHEGSDGVRFGVFKEKSLNAEGYTSDNGEDDDDFQKLFHRNLRDKYTFFE